MAIALADSAAAPPMSEPAPHWRGRVVVLVPPSIDDDVMRNALARVSGELAAAPFKTITVPIDPEGDIMAQIESAGNDRAATAAFAIVRDRGDPGSGRVTVWVSNRVSGITTVERMHVEGGNVDRAAARLAVETVELVRASLAELWPSPPVSTSQAGDRRDRRGSAHRARFALAVGFGLLADLGGAPGFWAPQISAVVRPGRRLRRARLGERVGVRGRRLDDGHGKRPHPARHADDRRDPDVPGGSDRPAVDRDRRRGPASVRGRYGGRAGAGRPRWQHDHGPGDGERGRGAARSARVSRPSSRRTCCWPGRRSRSASGTDVATFDRPSLYTHAGLLATF